MDAKLSDILAVKLSAELTVDDLLNELYFDACVRAGGGEHFAKCTIKEKLRIIIREVQIMKHEHDINHQEWMRRCKGAVAEILELREQVKELQSRINT